MPRPWVREPPGLAVGSPPWIVAGSARGLLPPPPRGLTSARIARLTVIFPLAYMVFTVIRGPLASDWYPYPFANPKQLGYPAVAVNALWIALLFIALAAGATALDKRLPGPAALRA